MAQLLAKHQSKLVTLKKGESVKGKITKLTRSEITVELGSKTEATVLEKEKHILDTIMSSFKVGDTVDVNVLNPESENGHPVVSLRRFLANRSWVKLEELEKNKAILEVTVQEVAKAGFIVVTDFGVSGFLPQSHVSQGDLKEGQSLKVTVLELNRKDNKIIFSQKPNLSDEDFAKVIKGLKIGDKVSAKVANVSSFGIFVTFVPKDVTLEGFIHISEVSWEKVDDLPSMYSTGDTFEAVIIRFDEDGKRVNLSLKRLSEDPFEAMVKKFPVDSKALGTVTKLDDTGVSLDLGDGVEGVIRKEKVPPGTKYTVGQEVEATVIQVDTKKRRIVLAPVLLEKPLMYR